VPGRPAGRPGTQNSANLKAQTPEPRPHSQKTALPDNRSHKQLDGGELAGARAFASKAAEHAARVAGVVELVSDPDAAEISVETMAGAIQVIAFYIGEHLRLTGASIEHQRLTQLQALVQWFREQPALVKHADLLQRTPRSIRTLKSDGIKPLIEELSQRGYIRAVGNAWEVRRGLHA
jgi:hypothetical protein